MSTIKLSVLTKEQAVRAWPKLSPFLMKAEPYTAKRQMTDDVLRGVEAGDVLILVVWKPELEKLYAVIAAERLDYAQRKVFNLGTAGGTDINEWKHLWPAFQQVARDYGCDQIEISGRRGWKKFIPGARETSTQYTMDLYPEETYGRQNADDEG